MTLPINHIFSGTVYVLVIGARLAGIGKVVYTIAIFVIQVLEFLRNRDSENFIKKMKLEWMSCFFRPVYTWSKRTPAYVINYNLTQGQIGDLNAQIQKTENCELFADFSLTSFLYSPGGMLVISMVAHPMLKSQMGECPFFIHDFWDKFSLKVFKL